MLAEQPFYQQELPAITPMSPEFMTVDLDAGLNETDRENLEDMSFELPNAVFKKKKLKKLSTKLKQQTEVSVKN